MYIIKIRDESLNFKFTGNINLTNIFLKFFEWINSSQIFGLKMKKENDSLKKTKNLNHRLCTQYFIRDESKYVCLINNL